LEDCHLLPQRKILQSDPFRTSQEQMDHAKQTEHYIEHECKSVAALWLKNNALSVT
jgi:hypothetical protein